MGDKYSVYALIVVPADPANGKPKRLVIGRKARMVGSIPVDFIPGMPEPLGGNRGHLVNGAWVIRSEIDTLVDEINEESGRQLTLNGAAPGVVAALGAKPLHSNTVRNLAKKRSETYRFFVIDGAAVTGNTGNNVLITPTNQNYDEQEMEATVEIDLSRFRQNMTDDQLIDELMQQAGSTPTAQELIDYKTKTETGVAMTKFLRQEADANGP